MSIVIELYWSEDLIDISDVESYHDYLKDRVHEATTCDWCWEDLTVLGVGNRPVHTKTGTKACLPSDLMIEPVDGVTYEAKPQGDPLDETEESDLSVIKQLEEQLSGGLREQARNGAVLIAHDHWVEYAEDYARSVNEIPDWLDSHIDWEGFADALAIDYTEIDINEPMYGKRHFRIRLA